MHRSDFWSLDDVDYQTDVKDFDIDRMPRDLSQEGVYLSGMFLEGAKWERKEGRLDEAEMKKMFWPMPCIYVTAAS